MKGMKIVKQSITDNVLFILCILAMFLFSSSILFMPYANEQGLHGNKGYTYLVGATFWASLVFGYLLLVVMNGRRRRFLQSENKKRKNKNNKLLMKQPWGVIGVCSNVPAKISDGVFLLSLVSFLVYMGTNSTTDYLNYILLSIILFSFHMHCLFNGKNYKYLISKNEGENKR